jgi:hypothetical protein
MTVLESMIIGQAMDQRFSFQVLYHSMYGAFVNMIDDLPDRGNEYWMVKVGGVDSNLGISEAILQDAAGQNVDVAWDYRDISKGAHTDSSRKQLKSKGINV